MIAQVVDTANCQYGTRRRPDRVTLGPDVEKVAAMFGLELKPWQRYVCDVALEINEDGVGNIVDIATGEVSGFESLIRWQRDGTIVSPGEFIPIAERSGLIKEIGSWVMYEAMREASRWQSRGEHTPQPT